MKKSLRSLLCLLMVLVLLLSLAPAVFAGDEDGTNEEGSFQDPMISEPEPEPDPEPEKEPEKEPEPEPKREEKPAITVSILPLNQKIMVGDDVTLKAEVANVDDSATYTWVSLDEDTLVVVSTDGSTAKFHAKAADKVTVKLTVRCDDRSAEASCTLTVEEEEKKPDPISVSFPNPPTSLKVGDSAAVSATVENAVAGASYEWTSSNSSLLSVSGSGTSATLSAGSTGDVTVTVTLTVYPGLGDSRDPASDSFEVFIEAEEQEEDLKVYLPDSLPNLEIGQYVNISATVVGADPDEVEFLWNSTDPDILSVEGSTADATLTAHKAGSAIIAVAVRRAGRRAADYDDYARVTVMVNAPTPDVVVTIRGADTLVMDAGGTAEVEAAASGGSGSYTWRWDSDVDNNIYVSPSATDGKATVIAGQAGSGIISLTVFDAADSTRWARVSWKVTVNKTEELTPPEAKLSQSSIEIGAGGTAALQLIASGGSGAYDYHWYSDSPAVVAIEGDGATVTLRATDTIKPNANTAQISALVQDKAAPYQTSELVTCVVTVTGGSGTHDASASAKAGDYLDMGGTFAASINEAYRRQFGADIDLGASVQFSLTGNAAGSIRLSDGTAVNAGTGYTFNTFYTMVFHAAASGSFSTAYIVTDGANTISGILSITVSGAIGVTDVTMDPGELKMFPNSNQYLSVIVTPTEATYTVTWSVDNSQIVSVAGSGSKITLKTGNRIGTAKVTAVVTDGNGKQFSRTCTVTVSDGYVPADIYTYYDPSITIMLGSDYYGSNLADALVNQFKNIYNVYLKENATIIFPTLGNSRYGTMWLKNGTAAQARQTYTFRDFVDMYFTPNAEGTYSLGYQLTYNGSMLQGTMSVIVHSASISVNLSPTALQMAPYSTQYLNLNVNPSSASYRVSWASSNPKVVTVTGSNTTAVLTSTGASGTATIYATVTDRYGVEIRRGCTVVVSSSGTTFNPTVSTTLGLPYVGTGTSSAMRSQFQALYGVALPDAAIIRFASTGNTEVAVMRLADGSMIRPNVDYTLGQYVAMYTQPVSAGTYSVPYTISYAGKTMNGVVSVDVNSASVSTDLVLTSRDPYWFSDVMTSGTGSGILSNNIRNTVGSGWAYIRFTSASDGTGTLYRNRNYAALTPTTDVTAADLSQLYFVPGALTGTFSAPYTIYSAGGNVLGTGTLRVIAQGVSFTDVPATAYYAPAVSWAVDKGITSGTGGTYFSPDMTVTRGQAMTFLWRAAGQPKVSVSVNPFTDVLPGSYYYDAVLWAVQQGITLGTSDTTFSPDMPLHRDQLLTFLCRANGGYAGGDDWSNLAVNWASTRGLLAGVPGTFVAAGDCPRSDVVYYLWKNYNG